MRVCILAGRCDAPQECAHAGWCGVAKGRQPTVEGDIRGRDAVALVVGNDFDLALQPIAHHTATSASFESARAKPNTPAGRAPGKKPPSSPPTPRSPPLDALQKISHLAVLVHANARVGGAKVDTDRRVHLLLLASLLFIGGARNAPQHLQSTAQRAAARGLSADLPDARRALAKRAPHAPAPPPPPAGQMPCPPMRAGRADGGARAGAACDFCRS